MARRAGRAAGRPGRGARADKVARIRFPSPAPCGRDPADGGGAVEVVRVAGGLHRRRPGRRPGRQVVVLGLNGAGKTTLLRLLAGTETAGHGRGRARARAADRLLRAGARHPGHGGDGVGEHPPRRAGHDGAAAAPAARAFMFSGRAARPARGHPLRREKTRLALAGLVSAAANVLLLDEPTNNLDPACREQVLDALRHYPGRSCWSRTTRGRWRR